MGGDRGGGGGNFGGCARRQECLEDAPMSGSSGGGVGDGRRQQMVMERCAEARRSGCSGEDGEVGMASVVGTRMQDLVKTTVEIDRGCHTKREGLGWLTGMGKRR